MNRKHNCAVKTVIVTGGSRGIGSEIAIQMAASGYRVCLTYKKNKELAHNIVTKILNIGGQAEAWKMDLSEPSSIDISISKIVNKYNRVDILINNAAMAQEKSFENITVEDWEQVLNCNLRGAFLCSQKVLPGMADNGWGRIINISSVGGQWGGWRQVHYATSKAGLLNLTRSIARIYGEKGITVNSVAPGLIKTEMTECELASEEGQIKLNKLPLGRAGIPEDIAATVVFLSSECAAYITGQTVNVNGGMYLK